MKNYGFQKPEITPEDYFLGSKKLGSQEINPSGDWRKYLPVFEHQSNVIETNSCVSFGTLSALEILHKFIYGTEPNYADRFLSKMSGTDPSTGGNTPNKVSQTLRKKGCIPETEYPFVDNLDEYFKEVPQNLVDLGTKWLLDYEFGYEWCDISTLKNALKRSPIGVAVSAWQTNDKGEYVRFGQSNHWVVLVAFDEQDRPIIYDSYEAMLKTLSKDFKLEFPMLYLLKKKPDPVTAEIAEYKSKGKNWFTQFWAKFLEYWYFIF